jgi:hypothetical protein
MTLKSFGLITLVASFSFAAGVRVERTRTTPAISCA